MIKERYVNVKVASLLRDKGFDEECFGAYTETNHSIIMFNGKIKNSEYGIALYTAPTQQMACDWIEENHKIHIVVRFVSKLGYVASVCDISNPDSTLYMLNTRAFPNMESVYNEALKCILTTMI